MMCVRLWVLVLQCMQTSSTESSILFRKLPAQCDARNEACDGFRGEEYLILF